MYQMDVTLNRYHRNYSILLHALDSKAAIHLMNIKK